MGVCGVEVGVVWWSWGGWWGAVLWRREVGIG